MLSLTGAVLFVLSASSTFGVAAAAGSRPRGGLRTRARFLALALAANLVGLPLLGLGLVRAAGVPADVADGVLLAAAAPAGSSGPLLALVAGGDALLAASLFTTLSVASALAVPAVLLATGALDAGGQGFAVAFGGIVAGQLVPLVTGLWVRRRWPASAPALARAASRLGLVLLVAVVAGYLVTRGHLIGEVGAGGVAVAGMLVLAGLGVGRLGPRLSVRERVAAAQVSAVRNLSVALLLAELLRLPPRSTLAVLVYGLVMYLVAGAAAALQRRRAALAPATGEG